MKTGLNILLLWLPILEAYNCLQMAAPLSVSYWTGAKSSLLSAQSRPTPQPGTQRPLLRAQPHVTGSPALSNPGTPTRLDSLTCPGPAHSLSLCALAHAALSSTLPTQILPIL